jgi:hypothetical protein
MFESALGLGDSCTLRPEMVDLTREMDAHHRPEKAPAYDVAEFLPRLWEGMQADSFEGRKNPICRPLQRIMVYTWFVLMHMICGRSSCLTRFCPTFEDIHLPKAEGCWDLDGCPKWLAVRFTRWKGASTGKEMRWLRFGRNTQSPMSGVPAGAYCPVQTLLLWLEMSKIETGPIFPRLKNGVVQFGQYMSDEKGVRAWNRKIRQVFSYIQPAPAQGNPDDEKNWQLHSIRYSSALAAQRMGATHDDIAQVGRWSGNTATMQNYLNVGRTFIPERGEEDPLKEFYSWNVSVINEAMLK